MTAVVEDQDQQAGRRAVLVCHHSAESRPTPTSEFTYWTDAAEAREASVELAPCGPRCIGVHTVARVDATAPARSRPGRPRGLRPRQRAPITTAPTPTSNQAG